MRLVLPGRPQAKSQALCTVKWRERRIVAYISGNALIILGGPNEIIQTIYHDRAESLDAVAIDDESGKIAVCWATHAYVYRPYEQIENLPRWSLQCSFDVECPYSLRQTLSWGSSEELLVGSDALRLFETSDEDHLIWNRQLSSPAIIADFSHDASLIVSVAQHDRLAKVWRRRSYGSDDVRFDYCYLAHPTTVTSAQWRRPDKSDYHEKLVLYTVCADNKIRIWAATDPHGLQLLQPWGEIDMQASIQPRIETTMSNSDRHVFLIDRMEFSQAISNTVLKYGNSSTKRHFIEHLLEIDVSKPDICVVLDSRGHMSAWAVDYVGPKSKSPTVVRNIAHLEDFNALTILPRLEEGHGIQMLTFATNESSSQLCLLVHRYDDSIDWLEGEVTDFFDPSPNSERLQRVAEWKGHSKAIERLVPNYSGESFMSWSSDLEGIVWSKRGNGFVMQSRFISQDRILDSCFLDGLGFVVTLHEKGISLWDIRHGSGRSVKCHALEKASCDRSLFFIKRLKQDTRHIAQFFAIIDPPSIIAVWRVTQNDNTEDGTEVENLGTVSLLKLSSTEIDLVDQYLGDDETVQHTQCSLTKPVHKLCMQQNEIIMSLTSGHVFMLKVIPEDGASHKNPCSLQPSSPSFSTNVEDPRIIAASHTKKMAMVDKTGTSMTIWDLPTGKLEYMAEYKANDIIGLQWLATPTGLSILAVGFMHRIVVLAETRLDQGKGGSSPWVEIQEIQMQEQTSQVIGGFAWLGDGNIVVATGNQLVIVGSKPSSSEALSNRSSTFLSAGVSLELFDSLEVLNCSLPVYHPQHLLQMALAGQTELARTVLTRLHNTLKFFSDGDEISSMLSMPANSFYSSRNVMVNGFKKRAQHANSDTTEVESLTAEEVFELLERIKSLNMPNMTRFEQTQLERVVESLNLDKKFQQSLDGNGTRFLTLFKHSTMLPDKASTDARFISWREVSWASHSQSQEILLDQVSRHFNGKLLWQSAREAGIFTWINDHTALRTQFEAVARNEYVKTDERDPIDCSLFYLTLKKKNVLQGLWRMASWNKEQASTQKLLANNFADPRWKTAALKNAYALLGKRRFGYAAAFFLLADNLRDAVNVCANQMHDLQLAIAVSRVYEGNDNGDVLKDLLQNRVLPEAAATGDRWMASWAFWMLGSGKGKDGKDDRRRALGALIDGPESVVSSVGKPSPESKSIHTIEPAQAILYRHLRDQLPPFDAGIPQSKEWKFVLQMARLYWRMGCGLLALNLLRNWNFVQPSHKECSISGSENDDEEESSADEEEAIGKVRAEVKEKQPPKPVFEEPSTNSLLESFGY